MSLPLGDTSLIARETAFNTKGDDALRSDELFSFDDDSESFDDHTISTIFPRDVAPTLATSPPHVPSAYDSDEDSILGNLDSSSPSVTAEEPDSMLVDETPLDAKPKAVEKSPLPVEKVQLLSPADTSQLPSSPPVDKPSLSPPPHVEKMPTISTSPVRETVLVEETPPPDISPVGDMLSFGDTLCIGETSSLALPPADATTAPTKKASTSTLDDEAQTDVERLAQLMDKISNVQVALTDDTPQKRVPLKQPKAPMCVQSPLKVQLGIEFLESVATHLVDIGDQAAALHVAETSLAAQRVSVRIVTDMVVVFRPSMFDEACGHANKSSSSNSDREVFDDLRCTVKALPSIATRVFDQRLSEINVKLCDPGEVPFMAAMAAELALNVTAKHMSSGYAMGMTFDPFDSTKHSTLTNYLVDARYLPANLADPRNRSPQRSSLVRIALWRDPDANSVREPFEQTSRTNSQKRTHAGLHVPASVWQLDPVQTVGRNLVDDRDTSEDSESCENARPTQETVGVRTGVVCRLRSVATELCQAQNVHPFALIVPNRTLRELLAGERQLRLQPEKWMQFFTVCGDILHDHAPAVVSQSTIKQRSTRVGTVTLALSSAVSLGPECANDSHSVRVIRMMRRKFNHYSRTEHDIFADITNSDMAMAHVVFGFLRMDANIDVDLEGYEQSSSTFPIADNWPVNTLPCDRQTNLKGHMREFFELLWMRYVGYLGLNSETLNNETFVQRRSEARFGRAQWIVDAMTTANGDQNLSSDQKHQLAQTFVRVTAALFPPLSSEGSNLSFFNR